MFRFKKYILIGLVLPALISGCNFPLLNPENIEPPIITTQPGQEATDNVTEATATPQQKTASPEEPLPPMIDLSSIAGLTPKNQIPFQNPISVGWNSTDNSFSIYSNEKLTSYSTLSLAASNSSDFDTTAQLLDVSPNGKTIAQTRDMANVEIMDIMTSEVVMTISPEFMINSADFSPDSDRIVITSMDEAVAQEYDLATGSLVDTYSGFEFAGPVYTVQYSILGNALLWYSRGSAMVQDLTTHENSTTFYHEDFINSIALSADGKTLAVSTAKTQNGIFGAGIQFWNRFDGTELGFINTTSLAKGLTYPNDGSLLLGADAETLCAWNTNTMELAYSFEGHNDIISLVSVSPDGRRILTGSFDNTIILWTIP